MHDLSTYPGKELELFEKAVNWKKYFSSIIKPYVKTEVAEVGAGLGANTLLLYNNNVSKWTLFEPDISMVTLLQKKLAAGELPGTCTVINGPLPSAVVSPQYDTIIYIDVLEHIEEDKKEVDTATRLLKPGGHLIILSPAFPFLYSPFDKAIGHYRRYTKKTLQQLIPSALSRVKLKYLDSTGFLLSMMNRLFLKQKYPTQRQVDFWDQFAVPVSGITDRIVIYSFGKSILGIWKKNDE